MDQLSYLDQIKFWLVAQFPQVDQYPQIARTLLQILHAGAWLVILAVIFIPLERLFALRPKKIFRKAVVTDVGYYFLNSLVPAFLLGFPLAAVALGTRHFEPAGFLKLMAGLPLWARLSGAAVVGEIGFYWGHRWSHEIPLLWRFHSVHHSAEDVDFLVSSRGHPVDLVFTRMCEMTPMYVLGLVSPTNLSGTADPGPDVLIGTVLGLLYPRQRELAVWPAGMACLHSRVSPLAPHQRRSGVYQQELRASAALGGQDVWHAVSAERQAAGALWHRPADLADPVRTVG
jgi:hypothetical protein